MPSSSAGWSGSRLWTFWDAVTASTLGFSGIRLRNALPPVE